MIENSKFEYVDTLDNAVRFTKGSTTYKFFTGESFGGIPLVLPKNWNEGDSLHWNSGVINELKYYNEVDYGAYFGGYLGNYYLVLFLPGEWSFELFEMYVKKEVNPWSRNNLKYATDYENVFGRKEYAKETSGGYYAARLPIVEKLRKMKRKGNVLDLK